MIVAVVLLEMVMLISVFYLRSLVVAVGTQPPRPAGQKTAQIQPTPEPVIIQSGTETPATNGTNTVAATNPNTGTVTPVNTGPMPMLKIDFSNIPVLSTSDRLDQINDYLTKASDMSAHHQKRDAEDVLHKAEQLDPESPQVLEALARYYDAAGDSPLSAQFWQRLIDLGPEVGSVYTEANDQLKLKGSFADPLKDKSQWPRRVYIRQVTKSTVKVEDDSPVFHVQVELGRTDTLAFDQRQLRPYVIFYQLMPDGSLKVDDNQKSGTFQHAFLFDGTNRESFFVTYTMPMEGDVGKDHLPVGTYYGFVVAVYYEGALQDARSQPTTLWLEKPLPDSIE